MNGPLNHSLLIVLSTIVASVDITVDLLSIYHERKPTKWLKQNKEPTKFLFLNNRAKVKQIQNDGQADSDDGQADSDDGHADSDDGHAYSNDGQATDFRFLFLFLLQLLNLLVMARWISATEMALVWSFVASLTAPVVKEHKLRTRQSWKFWKHSRQISLFWVAGSPGRIASPSL